MPKGILRPILAKAVLFALKNGRVHYCCGGPNCTGVSRLWASYGTPPLPRAKYPNAELKKAYQFLIEVRTYYTNVLQQIKRAECLFVFFQRSPRFCQSQPVIWIIHNIVSDSVRISQFFNIGNNNTVEHE